MKQVKLSLFINYFVFAMLLNSVGTVILQVQNSFGVSPSSASVLEAFKDLSIAAVSFLLASYITRIGYKNAMLLALALVTAACFAMPSLPFFWATKMMFAVVGTSFALIKMSVYSTIGLVTKDRAEHISLMNFIESFFMIGVFAGYFVFAAFVDNENPQSTSWMQVYYLLGAMSLAAFVLLFTAPLDDSAARAKDGETMLTGKDAFQIFGLLALPLVLVFVLCAFFYVLVEQSIMSWLPTFNNRVLGLSPELSLQMTSILAISTAAGRFISGVLIQKINWFTLLTGCLVIAAGIVLVALPFAGRASDGSITYWGDAPITALVFPLIGLVLAPIYPAINSLILSALPVEKHGLMSGLIIVFSALGGTTGSILTGHISERFGGLTAFYLSLIPMAILMTGLYLFKKQLK